MPSDKFPEDKSKYDPEKIPEGLSYKKTMDDEAKRQDLLEKFKKWDQELDEEEATLSRGEKFKRELELEEKMEELEKDLAEAEKDPIFRTQIREMIDDMEEHKKRIEEIKKREN